MCVKEHTFFDRINSSHKRNNGPKKLGFVADNQVEICFMSFPGPSPPFQKGFSRVKSEDFGSNVNDMCKGPWNYLHPNMYALQNIETEHTLEGASIIEPNATWKYRICVRCRKFDNHIFNGASMLLAERARAGVQIARICNSNQQQIEVIQSFILPY